MQYQYIGDGNEPPHKVTVFGYDFTLNGEPVEVSDAVAQKLSGIKTFKYIEEEKCFQEPEIPVEAVVDSIAVRRGRPPKGRS